MSEIIEDSPSDDIVWGTQAIADEIGRSLTETQYLIRIGALPIGRLGPKTIIASRRQLRHHLQKTSRAEARRNTAVQAETPI